MEFISRLKYIMLALSCSISLQSFANSGPKCEALFSGYSSVHSLPALKLKFGELEIEAPEVVFDSAARDALGSDENAVAQVIKKESIHFNWSGSDRKVTLFQHEGREMVAKVYKNTGDPATILLKIQRELLVQDFLRKKGVALAPLEYVSNTGVVIQEFIDLPLDVRIRSNPKILSLVRDQLRKLGDIQNEPSFAEIRQYLWDHYRAANKPVLDFDYLNIAVRFPRSGPPELVLIDW